MIVDGTKPVEVAVTVAEVTVPDVFVLAELVLFAAFVFAGEVFVDPFVLKGALFVLLFTVVLLLRLTALLLLAGDAFVFADGVFILATALAFFNGALFLPVRARIPAVMTMMMKRMITNPVVFFMVVVFSMIV